MFRSISYALACAAIFVLCGAATCEEIPPDAECVFDGTYVNLTSQRPGNDPSCGELDLPPAPPVNHEARPCQYDFPEDGTRGVCLPGNPVEYCYQQVTFGACSWDVLTVLQ